MSGFGSQPFGSSPYGIGTPATAPEQGGALLRDTVTGQTRGARRIDPLARDYVLDENGRLLGVDNIKQLVQLAISTSRGSAAMRRLGQALREIDRVSPNFQRRVDQALREAVQHLVNDDLIEVVGTEVQILRSGVAFARLRWRDLETGLDEEELVQALRG